MKGPNMTKEKLLEYGWELSPLKAHHCKGFKKPGFVEGFEACLELLWPLTNTVLQNEYARFEGDIEEEILSLKQKLEQYK